MVAVSKPGIGIYRFQVCSLHRDIDSIVLSGIRIQSVFPTDFDEKIARYLSYFP